MKKALALAIVIALSISINLSAKVNVPELGNRTNYNETCGPVWDAPDPVSCEMNFETYVYHPLDINCWCRFALCLGWFYPGQTYDVSSLEAQFSPTGIGWDLWGEKDYWVEVIGNFQTESPDHNVKLSNIHWQYYATAEPWIDILSDVNGDFDKDFKLMGTHPSGPTWGALHFRVWVGTVTTLAGAHGFYFFTNSLWAQYNF